MADEQTPTLADRLEAEQGHPDGGDITLADLRAAAVRLRQLDRIEATCRDARAVADALIESGDLVVPAVAPAAVTLLCRLADALEDDRG